MRILVDMDGVIADFEKVVLDTYKTRYPNEYFVSQEQRTSFYIAEQFPNNLKPLIREIYTAQGFYLTLPPIEGSLEALAELSNRGDEVYICTSPILSNPFCVQEKYIWVMERLGRDWTERVIVSKDKTLIDGDILIDDKPEIKGVQQPSWEHILYSQPYNTHINSKRRMTWQNWKSIIDSE